MSYNLFLDDERMPINAFTYTFQPRYTEEAWTIVRSYDEFVDCITLIGMPSLVSFDHDLGDIDYQGTGGEMTGYDCVKWLIDYCMENKVDFPCYMLHTANTVGKENMLLLIENFIRFSQHGRL